MKVCNTKILLEDVQFSGFSIDAEVEVRQSNDDMEVYETIVKSAFEIDEETGDVSSVDVFEEIDKEGRQAIFERLSEIALDKASDVICWNYIED